MNRVDISKDRLKNLYINQKLTTYQIASIFNCCQATIWKRLVNYRIPRRLSYIPVDLTREQLKRWYLGKKLSTWKIEKLFGYPRGTVYRKLREFEITTRNIAASHIFSMRKNFSKDRLEKAYLIGFRIGDLNVSKRGPQSETIIVKCGTTQKSQLVLFRNLFQKYGPILEGKPTKQGKINIQANLDLSFLFLLENNWHSHNLVFNKRNTFFSFLAGFSDAEGSFMITKDGQANFALGNYNRSLLDKIKFSLATFGVEVPKITTFFGKGLPTYDIYKRNNNYHTLHCSRKKYLLKLVSYLKPYLRHPDKIKKVKILEKNIEMRNIKYGYLKMD